MNQANGFQKFFPQKTLEQVGSSAGFERAQHLNVSCVGRQNDNSRSREFPANRNHGIDTVHFRHLQIHQGHIGTMQSVLCDRLSSVGCLGNQCHVGLSGQKRGHALAEQRMVVDRENTNGGAVSAHDSPPVAQTLVDATIERRMQLHLRARSYFAPHIELRADLLCSLTHAWQTPMSIASRVQELRVNTLSIVPDAQPKKTCAVGDLGFNFTRPCVAERISQSLARNAVNVVAENRMQVARCALYGNVERGGVPLAIAGGRELFTQRGHGLGQLVSYGCGRT